MKNFAANIFFKLVNESRIRICASEGGVHILKSSEVLKRWKGFAVSSSTGIVESKDKGFVLDLKLLFSIVDCFSGRLSPRFFTMKMVGFIDFPRLSYLVLFIFFAA